MSNCKRFAEALGFSHSVLRGSAFLFVRGPNHKCDWHAYKANRRLSIKTVALIQLKLAARIAESQLVKTQSVFFCALIA
jgi:hypothetical protein